MSLRDDIEQEYRDCREPDWDGYGAEPVTEESKRRALEFAAMIPADLPEPEVAAEPDGEIGFEWYVAGSAWCCTYEGGQCVAAGINVCGTVSVDEFFQHLREGLK